MMRRLTVVAVVLAISSGPGLAQPPFRERFYETAEPPLADGSNVSRAAPQQNVPTRIIDSPTPVVHVAVRAPQMSAAGGAVPVTLFVENVSKAVAQNVTVFYPLPAGVTVAKSSPEGAAVAGGIVWKFETLPAGTRKDITLSVTPAANTTELAHKARVGFEFEQTSPATQFAKAELKLKKSGPDQALKHDILVFSVDATNTGKADLTEVQIVDALPDGLEHRADDPTAVNQPQVNRPVSEISPDKRTRTFKLGRLKPGQTGRIEYYVAAVNTTGAINHSVSATAAGLAEPAKAENRVTLAEPKLEIKVEAPPRRPANQPARVQIKLTNRSIRALANIVVTDRLSPTATVENVSSGGQSFGSTAQWIVPMLAPNETRVFEATVRSPQGGRVANQVSAVYRGLSQVAEAATEFDAIAALQTEFRMANRAVELNGEVQCTLVVRNLGSAPASNVRPVIVLPAELKLVKATPAAAGDGGRAAFDAVTVPPGGRLECVVTAKAVQTAVDARILGEVAADALTAGPLKKQEVVTIGGNELAVPTQPVAQPALPTPAPPPKKNQ